MSVWRAYNRLESYLWYAIFVSHSFFFAFMFFVVVVAMWSNTFLSIPAAVGRHHRHHSNTTSKQPHASAHHLYVQILHRKCKRCTTMPFYINVFIYYYYLYVFLLFFSVLLFAAPNKVQRDSHVYRLICWYPLLQLLLCFRNFCLF